MAKNMVKDDSGYIGGVLPVILVVYRYCLLIASISRGVYAHQLAHPLPYRYFSRHFCKTMENTDCKNMKTFLFKYLVLCLGSSYFMSALLLILCDM
jgi:hypothetical protein